MPAQRKEVDGRNLTVARLRWPWFFGAILIVAIVGLTMWSASLDKTRTSISTSAVPQVTASASDPHGPSNSTAAGDLTGSLLDQMSGAGAGRGANSGTSPAVLTNEQLEKQSRNVDVGAISGLDERLLSLQRDLRVARAARPDDPIVQWLTGELLIRIGGEPEEILPYFERAANSGLQRPDVLASLARVQFEANQFQSAYRSGLKALSLNDQDPKVWETFERVAVGPNNSIPSSGESIAPSRKRNQSGQPIFAVVRKPCWSSGRRSRM